MTDTELPAAQLYNSRFQTWGRDHRTVGWGSPASQQLRFAELFRGLRVDGAHILDVGCGLGDLIPWLIDTYGSTFTYTGLDVASDLIADARENFGSKSISFVCEDVQSSSLPNCDIAVASGALSLRPAWTLQKGLDMLKRMFESSSTCTAANFLTDRVDYQEARNLHYPPERVLGYALDLTSAVKLGSGYGLYEFTVQLFHTKTGDMS